jgi:hypothetical protein
MLYSCLVNASFGTSATNKRGPEIAAPQYTGEYRKISQYAKIGKWLAMKSGIFVN